MNRFFRSAFFPLVVIAALAWLAVKVLHTGTSQKPTTYSQMIQYAETGQISNVVFIRSSTRVPTIDPASTPKITGIANPGTTNPRRK